MNVIRKSILGASFTIASLLGFVNLGAPVTPLRNHVSMTIPCTHSKIMNKNTKGPIIYFVVDKKDHK